MLIEKILGKKPENTDGKIIETVPYDWFEMNNKILKKVSSRGTEIGLRLSEPLFDGAVLYEDNEKIICLELLPCETTRVHIHNIKEMGRVCFELGNRHLPLSIAEDSVSTPHDNPTFEYLEKLGFHCERVTEKFKPEIITHGHHHDDHHNHHGHQHGHHH
jgi:urease accessory protein